MTKIGSNKAKIMKIPIKCGKIDDYHDDDDEGEEMKMKMKMKKEVEMMMKKEVEMMMKRGRAERESREGQGEANTDMDPRHLCSR